MPSPSVVPGGRASEKAQGRDRGEEGKEDRPQEEALQQRALAGVWSESMWFKRERGRSGETWASQPDSQGSRPDSATLLLCDPVQVTWPLCAKGLDQC